MSNYLHIHSMYSLYDSPQTPEEIVKRIKELNGKNVTLTDHGSLLGIEPFMDAGKKYGINTIPGVEAYTENRHHLILIAKNYDGYVSISHAMRDANLHIEHVGKRLTYPIMTKEIIEKYFKGNNNVIATTACIQGIVPFTLLENLKKTKELDKITANIEKFKEDERLYEDCLLSVEQCKSEISKIKQSIKDTHKFTLKPYIKSIKDKEKKLEKARQILIENPYDSDAAKQISKLICIIDEMKLNRNKGLMIEQNAENRIDEIKNKINACKQIMKKKSKGYNAYNSAIKKRDEICLVNEDKLFLKAKKELRKLKEIFPNLYVELQYHGLKEEAFVMPLLVELAESLKLPLIASNDAHITYDSDDCVEARRIMRYNYFDKANIVSSEERTLFIKTPDEIKKDLLKIIDEEAANEAINNLDILNECRVTFPNEKHYPKCKSSELFDELLEKEKKRRINMGKWNDIYEKRLQYEVRIIKDMGFVDYHMIVQDICNMARILGRIPKDKLRETIDKYGYDKIADYVNANNLKSGIGIGPGRGSAAGSLVCYMLGITNIDPIKYDLVFERFLNPERVTMPDIDSDIRTSLRPYIIEYLKWKYGEKAVCSIATETCMGIKAAIKLAGRDRASQLYGNDKKAISEYTNRYVDTLSDAINDDDVDMNSAEQRLVKAMTWTDEQIKIWQMARLIENKLISTSVHAGGVVMSDTSDINEYIPLAWNESKKVWCAQCDMVKVEEKGLLKIDLLGLINLDYISDCISLIREHRGIEIDYDNLPFERIVFQEIYAKGNTNSVFQFESEGMKNMLKAFKPDSFEDIIILIAAYRPGPMQYLEDIIKIKHGEKELRYKTPMLEPILSNTYGAVIYQEQVMQIFQKLAGYSLGGADLVRRAMSKKKTEVLEKERISFIYGNEERGIVGCVNNGVNEEIAGQIFDDLIDFAKYAFNRSHATVYALVSYITAYLKWYYTPEFLCAVFNNKEKSEYGAVIEDCKNYDVPLLPLDINRSYFDFKIENFSIRYGFKGVTQIGEGNRELYNTVCTNRMGEIYTSVQDFLIKNIVKVNNKYKVFPYAQFEILAKVGAFDTLKYKRENIVSMPQIVENKSYSALIDNINAIKVEHGYADVRYNIECEIEYLGFVLSCDPLEKYNSDEKYGCIPFDEIEVNNKDDKEISIYGFIVSSERKISRKGKDMLILNVLGKKGKKNVYLMGDKIIKYNENDMMNKVYRINGKALSDTVFMASNLTYLPPYNKCMSLRIDTAEQYEVFENKYSTEEVGYEVHVCTNYIRIKNEIKRTEIPMFQTVFINNQTLSILKESGLKINEW